MRRFWISLFLSLSALCQAQAAPDPIRVVVVGPETGDTGTEGQQEQLGARAAVRDLGEAGVLGHPVRVEVFDDACDTDLATAIAQKLASEQPAVVIGHGCSAGSLAGAPIYAAHDVLQIMPGSTNPKLTELGIKTIFRMIGRDDLQGALAADLIARRWPKGKIAVLDDGTVFGKGLADVTQSELRQHGLADPLRADYRFGERDFRDLTAQLAAAHIEAIFIGGGTLDIALLTQQVRKIGLSSQIIGADPLSNAEFWRLAGRAGEGTLFTFPPDLRGKPAAAKVVARFRADGFEPEGYTLLAYAAVQLWAEAATAANSLAGPAVAAALRANPLPSVLGTVTFDAKGDISGEVEDFVWYTWHDGKMTRVSSGPNASH